MMKLVVVAVVAVIGMAWGEEAPAVRTESGWVAGVVEKTDKGRTIHSYNGVPFTQPPLGRLRFKPPEAVLGWEGVRKCSKPASECLQPNYFKWLTGEREMSGSEDCLYLNVFTPASVSGTSSKKLPVMVFIHGGGFFFGAAYYYLPTVLLDHDVILVVLQYRLGVLGFLSTEDEVLPGNLGLLDQAEGLRWVQRNIQQFGGDPDRVTIFGESAGGSSIHYHLLSPLTKGLFSGAIMQSGSALSPWARGGSFRKVAEQVGRGMGCPDLAHSPAFLACLQKAPALDLASSIYDFLMIGIHPTVFAPRVDGLFLPEEPALLVKEGRHHHVPVFSGTNAHEGAFDTAHVYGNVSHYVPLLTENPEVQLTSLELGEGDVAPSAIAARIFKHYMGGPHYGEEHAEAVNKMYGDRLFVVDQEVVSRHYALTAPTFTYELTYLGQHSLTTLFAGTRLPYKWVSHADDLLYLFSGGLIFGDFPLSTPEDLHVKEIMTRLWVNFATTRNPTPDASLGFTWTPLSPADPHHLVISSTPTMAPDHRQQMLDFWASLPLKENFVLAPNKVVYEDGHKEEL